MSASATQTTSQVSIPLRRAGHWLLHSGIQEAGGGVARYYRIDRGQNRRISSEITGYAVSSYCYLHALNGDPRYLAAAQSSARFLTELAWDSKLAVFPFEWPRSTNPQENRVYFFDTGIIIRGLLSLWRATSDQALLDIAIAAGRAMTDVFLENGEFAPILEYPSLDVVPYGESWSNNPGCYQLKSALAWHELFLITAERMFEHAWEQALSLTMADAGDFVAGASEPSRVMDRLHAYCYYLEALLAVASRPEVQDELRTGIDQTARCLSEIAPVFDRSDVYAQLLRIRLFAESKGVTALHREAAREEADAIPHFQFASPDARIDGGFCFGRRKGHPVPHANPVSTAFCLQALQLWENRSAGVIHDTWQILI